VGPVIPDLVSENIDVAFFGWPRSLSDLREFSR
jgi:hypothetical protein